MTFARNLAKIISEKQVTKTLNRSAGKSRMERSLEDVEKGNVFFFAGPKLP